MSDQDSLVALAGVSKHQRGVSRLRFWPGGAGRANAVDDVSLTIARGEVLGLVGETGSGKSTLGRLSLMLERPSAGRVHFDGVDITGANHRALRLMRRHAQLVVADPLASLDATRTVGSILASPLRIHERAMSRADRRMRVQDILTMVGLATHLGERRPHELSSGQRQRVTIARALATQPRYVVLDEPTAALDATIQAQILNLLVALKERFRLAYLFVSHDLRLARYLSDRIAVMYLGRIIEHGDAEEIWRRPRHPYTRALLAAAGDGDGAVANGPLIRGEVPSLSGMPTGCAFQSRCPAAGPRCQHERPRALEHAGMRVACHLHDGGVEARG